MIDVRAYDVEKGDSRVFKVMRIHSVEATETPWAFEDKHKVKKPDVFRMTCSPVEKVVLQLNTRAQSLLVEEYPLARMAPGCSVPLSVPLFSDAKNSIFFVSVGYRKRALEGIKMEFNFPKSVNKSVNKK